MKLLKKVLAGVAVAAAMASAHASPITVSGVTWDPDYVTDFAGFASRIKQVIAADGSLSGFGYINEMNNSKMSGLFPGDLQMMAVGHELTFEFGGFTLAPSYITPTGTGMAFGYTGGWMKIYADNVTGGTTQVNPGLIATSTGAGYNDGTLFLSLVAVADPVTGLTLGGTTTASGGNGSGAFAVNGGTAMGNFNTNQAAYGADFDFNSSFTQRLGAPNPYSVMVGNANFGGNSIPEPESLALVGLGLLGLAAARRRKSA